MCPPPDFNAVPDLDLATYVSAPWYVQQQVPISYQGEGDPIQYMYCVRAEYIPLDEDDSRVRMLDDWERRRPGWKRGGGDGDDEGGEGDGDEDGGDAVRMVQVVNYANRGKVSC